MTLREKIKSELSQYYNDEENLYDSIDAIEALFNNHYDLLLSRIEEGE